MSARLKSGQRIGARIAAGVQAGRGSTCGCLACGAVIGSSPQVDVLPSISSATGKRPSATGMAALAAGRKGVTSGGCRAGSGDGGAAGVDGADAVQGGWVGEGVAVDGEDVGVVAGGDPAFAIAEPDHPGLE